MSSQKKPERLPLTAWEAELIRFTAFPIPATPTTDMDWWNRLIGEPPKTKTQRPRDGTIIEEGPFYNDKLVVQISPIRIDLLFVPDEQKEPREVSAPIIGTFTECLESFIELVLRWFNLDTCPPIQRIALGAVLRLPVSDKEVGYRQLSAYLPCVNLDAEHSYSFLYQINRPRLSTSSLTGQIINRLTKWSVSRLQKVGLTFVVTEHPTIHPNVSSGSFACRLELDINTDQEWNKQLPPNELPKIFNELVELTKQIVENGDIP